MMKALKIIGIIAGLLVAAILIIPLFSPATVEVKSETEIALAPSQLFPFIASFSDRAEWDPWLTIDSTSTAHIEAKPGYVGSTYTWEGEIIGTGKMEVVSVVENEAITSNLFFGDTDEPAKVRWEFEPVEGATRAIWSFAQETAYPFERLSMMIGKSFLLKSFETGLSNLKSYLEAHPPVQGSLGPISTGTQASMMALVAKEEGSMEEIPDILDRLFGLVMSSAEGQGLSMTGPPFSHYMDYDESTGRMTIAAGVQVEEPGVTSGEVVPVWYDEMEVVTAIHTGPFEALADSYAAIESYIMENGLETTGEVFEFYLTDPETEKDPSNWKTVIAFPLQ